MMVRDGTVLENLKAQGIRVRIDGEEIEQPQQWGEVVGWTAFSVLMGFCCWLVMR